MFSNDKCCFRRFVPGGKLRSTFTYPNLNNYLVHYIMSVVELIKLSFSHIMREKCSQMKHLETTQCLNRLKISKEPDIPPTLMNFSFSFFSTQLK
ncbi:CLUMA_CG011777, isoform A [Clunio marinus]|uniref:CLUMA_CG011777, isoform A n=1 Tax=Clunio marinus TaxID=568069 RepID=A0A1J1IDX9_9DIPT|nr:CLUMA_CG011777, isoform A [Clunio marinus]